jgi:hypothetical protein
MRHLTSRVVALERAADVVDEKLSATARLERVQRVIDEELSWALQEARREGGDRSAWRRHPEARRRSPPAARLPALQEETRSLSATPAARL